uniref:Uncharacterized protein n=1 Tax=Sipha flava TaxID=143950 RepID=A0A2S2Q6F5_9HEMI
MLRNMLLMFIFAAFVATSSQVSYTHQDFCPYFGGLDVKNEAVVLAGAHDNVIPGGCISKELVPNGAFGDYRLNVWLGLKPTDGTFCNNTDKMDFFQFSCISSWYGDADKGQTIMFVRLYDRAARHGRMAARCAIYQKFNSGKNALLTIALDDDIMCKDLGEHQNNFEHMTFSLKSNWTDQTVVLFLNMGEYSPISNALSVEKYTKSKPKLRIGEINKKMNTDETLDNVIRPREVLDFSKRLKNDTNNDVLMNSRSQDITAHHVLTRSRRAAKGYRFPEWAQGCWTNLCINDDTATFDTSVLYESDIDETEDQEVTDGNVDKSGNPQKVRRDTSKKIKNTDDPIFPPTPPPSPPRSLPVEKIFNAPRRTQRSKRAPCSGDATTPKSVSTTGAFPVKFRDEDDPIDGFNSGKREVDIETDMEDEEALLKAIKDEELKDITILTDSWNAVKARKGNDKRLPTAGEFVREAVSRGMPMTKALEKWQTVLRLNRMWESHTNVHKKVPMNYYAIVTNFENYINKRKEPRAIYLNDMKTGVMTDSKFPDSHRKKRSTMDALRSSKTEWRNVMPVDFDENIGQPENIAKFLIMGGKRVGDEHYLTHDTSYLNNENKSDSMINIAINESLIYGCMWLVRRDKNIIEYAVLIANNAPKPYQPLLSFAREVCAENKTVAPNSDVKSHTSPRPHQQRWITETRNNVSDRVLVSCPVLPGTVFYGKLPPSPAAPVAVDDATASVAGASNEPSPAYCVRLISSVDDVASGREGFSDRMKYTVSECIDPTSLTGISPQPMNTQVTNEEREYKCLGQWSEDRPIGKGDDVTHTMLTYMYVQRLDRPNINGVPEYECYVVTSIPNQPGQDPRATTLLLTEAGKGTHCSRLADPYVDGMKLVGTKINSQGALHTPRQHQTRRPPPTQVNIGFRTVWDPIIVGLLLFITISLW